MYLCDNFLYWNTIFVIKEYQMSNNQKFNNLGDQFKYAVQDAINKGDFQKLNFLVTDTVTDVIAEASTQFKKATTEVQKEFNRNSQQPIRKTQPIVKKYLPVSKTKKVGQVSSILYMVFGSIGLGTFFLLFIICLFAMMVTSDWMLPVLIIFALCGGGFAAMLGTGISQNKRLSRMKRYIGLCDDNMYVNINELAQHTHKSTQYVLKDVKKMLQLGFFPEGHLDKKESCLMLDDATYREYLRVEEHQNTLAQEAAAKQATPPTPEELEKEELNSIISEGQDYIQKLHHLNDLIEDEIVSEKLYHMEDLLKEIFKRLEDDPEQMPKTRKLMNYYLPTTIKLLQAYSEFDDVSAPNQDITCAKAEIEKTIDVINEAFTELLNKLFQQSDFDAATDAQVLQTMLAKEGMTKTKMTEDI